MPVSPVSQLKSDIVEHGYSKSAEASKTPKNGTIDKQIIKLLKDANLDNKSSSFEPNTELTKSQIATYNNELFSSVGTPLEKQTFKNIRITPVTTHTRLQILDTERRNGFQSLKRRSQPLNLKKLTYSKGDSMNEDKLSNDIVKKGMLSLN